TIIMTVGNSEVLVDGKKLLLDAPPVIKNGRTFVPLRFISEAFGAEVSWDEATRTVTVVYDK
ncbi:MAG TPA: copper amine oxidase N-terminal domain-containing protein, partial [Caldisericia bacterium]|nr:copper amine oxidase N-terminal domain-containing protein [Caldisericia bacterium]